MKFKAFLALSIATITTGCSDLCANDISQAMPSPSGKLKAVVFTRDCGATTGFSTQVSILPNARVLPNEAGNVLILNDAVPLALEWKSDTSLNISRLGGRPTFKKDASVAGVAISYAN